jgi:predicted N-formylglutamate amidohydrolase
MVKSMSDFISAHAIGPKGKSRAFLFCDHATNALPSGYGSLGLSQEQISDHIAFDPGAAALTRELSERLNARSVYCGYSRLLIDPNRGLDRDDLVMEQSDCITVPGNQKLEWEEREHRINTYYRPYHDFLDRELDAHATAIQDPLIISIHSFCRALRCRESHRPWEAGILWKDDEASASTIIAALRNRGLSIGDNEPYSAKAYNYTVDRHVGARGLRHLTLEIRQDLIADQTHVRHWAELLELPLQALMGDGV